MKKSQCNSLVKYGIATIFLGVLSYFQVISAQNKVVVIPWVDDMQTVSPPAVNDPFTNSIGMQFKTLPAGSFTMGSPVGEPGRVPAGNGAETEHTVTLTKGFAMQVTEVTNAQWDEVIVDTSLGANPSLSHTQDNYPVETVSWYDAIFFANRLSINEGRSVCYDYGVNDVSGVPGSTLTITGVTQIANCTGYRLPTEAEWEYAARAGSTNAYANPIGFDSADTETGNGLNSNLHAMGWYSYGTVYEIGTKPVAKKQANAWGLYDMHGNVFEWNWDWFAAYSGNDETDPNGPVSGFFRVIRGGGWNFPARDARSAFRHFTPPGFGTFFVGFRLVLSQVVQ